MDGTKLEHHAALSKACYQKDLQSSRKFPLYPHFPTTFFSKLTVKIFKRNPTTMAMNSLLYLPKPPFPPKPPSPPTFRTYPTAQNRPPKSLRQYGTHHYPKNMLGLLGAGLTLTLTLMGPASAAELLSSNSLQLSEPSNALSLPTWAVHVSSVVEWITAMALVWQYGEKSGFESWKGLSWGMVPLLGGAMCACTWHFFYNSESLEVLVALQAALTVIGNATMCFAAFRIYRSSEERSKNL